MIKIVIAIFLVLFIIGLIAQYWKEMVGLIFILGIGWLLFSLFGLHGIIGILIILGIIALFIKALKLLISEIKIIKYKSILKPYMQNMKIETYNSILNNTNLNTDDCEVKMAFNEIRKQLDLCSEKENNNIYYMSRNLRNNIRMKNYNAMINTIDKMGMANYGELISKAGVNNNWFVSVDLEKLCREKKIIKEIISTANKTKEICYKSSHYLDKNYSFSNYNVQEINLD